MNNAWVAIAAAAGLIGCGTSEEESSCATASAILAQCGQPVTVDVFRTCQPAQQQQASAVVESYEAQGCGFLAEGKADGLLCTLLPFVCGSSYEPLYTRIHNDTDTSVYYFYIAASGSEDWGGDVMRVSTLYPGASMQLNFGNGEGTCEFDFLVELSTGETLRRDHVDVCAVRDYHLTE